MKERRAEIETDTETHREGAQRQTHTETERKYESRVTTSPDSKASYEVTVIKTTWP